MPRLSRSLVLAVMVLGTLPVRAADTTRRLCPEDAPEGVRLPASKACPGAKPDLGRSEDGFHWIGDVKVRVGGRVTLDHDMRR
ncbi:hypothetical protein [Methylobacterium sp. 77]|uniref:hypothetical protein n=1 Tax=Methylobacterium sp. 77 TaxID=1101192 RepID=UPI0003609C9A|nr:hypothetical protein [Methylobacterium sp. 77]